jgi:dephospho-CoA kinase
VALTGGIATGKSYCLQQFARCGAAVIDADAIARDVLSDAAPALAPVRSRFGSAYFKDNGELDRAALADLVFADPAARRDLEAIVHPLVYRRIEEWFALLPQPIGIADIPLLYETDRAGAFDRVVVAFCPPALQRARLLARGLAADQADRRIAAQLPIDVKRARADFAIDTSGATSETDRQVAETWARLQAGLYV